MNAENWQVQLLTADLRALPTATQLRCATCGRLECPNLRHAGVARVDCDHENAYETGFDAYATYSMCPDCGAAIREDR